MSNFVSCPCSPEKDYAQCCEPFHHKTAIPETAEQLMRSRYSAYALAGTEPLLVHYLAETHDPRTFRQGEAEIKAMQAWAEVVSFTQLQVLSTFAGRAQDKVGKVTFAAHYERLDDPELKGKPQVLAECSRFRRYRGKWVYVDGEMR